MEKVELMQEKIAKERQLPNDIKEKLNNITFINLIISVALMIYVIVVNLLLMNATVEIFSNSAKASAFIFAIIDVILFEIAYRKESGTLAVHAIELLCISLFMLLIPYILVYLDANIRGIIMISPVFLSIYYVGKSIMIHTLETKKYINSLSDVLEILQDDTENQGYIEDDESEKVAKNEILSNPEELKGQINKKEMRKTTKREATKKEKNND